jgi:NAD(P)-dependent dehydrogenase (short-subunit alcohol dehydrogenase family)
MKVALITGGTRGIGKGCAQALAATGEYGGFLLTYNTNGAAAESFADELRAAQGVEKVVLVGGDLTEEASRDEIFEQLDSEFKEDQLAVLVHNAGQYVGVTSDNAGGLPASRMNFGNGTLLDAATGKPDFTYMRYYQKLYAEAWIDLCERSLARMKEARERIVTADNAASFRGSIVGISSPGCNAAYKMSQGYDMPGSGKCIMEFSIRSYAAATAELGINCNVVIPGCTKTEAWDKVAEQRGTTGEAFLKAFVQHIPMPETIEPKEIGDVVAFLAGPGGGRFMTGLSLRVDGGLHLGKPAVS